MGEARRRKLTGDTEPKSQKQDLGEREFWQSTAATLIEDWDVYIPDESPDSGSHALSADLFVYVIDVTSAWTRFGGFRENDVRRLVGNILTAPVETRRQIVVSAGSFIADLAESGNPITFENVRIGILGAMAAMTQTQIFAQVSSSRGISGHWLYLLYRCNDAHVMARPAYAAREDEDNGPLSHDAVMRLVKEAIEADFSGSTTVGRSVKAHGGIKIAPILR